MFRKHLLGAIVAALLLVGVVGAQTQVGNFLHIFINGNRVTATAGTAVVTVPNSTTTLVGHDTTNTLTNKTLDAEGTGNVLTLSFTEWWPAGVVDGAPYTVGWNTPSPAGTTGPTDTANGSGVSLYHTLRFDDSATESINRQFALPTDWTGALNLMIYWQTTATTGNVVWQVATVCIADNENMDPTSFSYNAAQTVTDAAKGSATFLNTALIASLTTTGCAADELLIVKLFRDPANAGDTLANNADLVGVKFTYRRTL